MKTQKPRRINLINFPTHKMLLLTILARYHILSLLYLICLLEWWISCVWEGGGQHASYLTFTTQLQGEKDILLVCGARQAAEADKRSCSSSPSVFLLLWRSCGGKTSVEDRRLLSLTWTHEYKEGLKWISLRSGKNFFSASIDPFSIVLLPLHCDYIDR